MININDFSKLEHLQKDEQYFYKLLIFLLILTKKI